MEGTYLRRFSGVGIRSAIVVNLVVVATVTLFFAGTAGWRFSTPPARSGPGGPNVIFVVLDALRFDHLSAYGYVGETFPRAAATFGASGVIFAGIINVTIEDCCRQ